MSHEIVKIIQNFNNFRQERDIRIKTISKSENTTNSITSTAPTKGGHNIVYDGANAYGIKTSQLNYY